MYCATVLCFAFLWSTGETSTLPAAISCSSSQFACNDGKRCIPKSSLCDRKDDCDDQSDEQLCDGCSLGSLSCGNESLKCYGRISYCDGEVDCPNGVDEKFCPVATCSSSEEACKHGPCVSRNSSILCCPLENNQCSTNPNRSEVLRRDLRYKLIRAEKHRLIVEKVYAKTRQTFYVKDGTTDNLPVTALAYAVTTETLFWTAGQKLWAANLLSVGDTQGHCIGELKSNCSIGDMAYDYINGSFYFLCNAERIIKCFMGIETLEMFCVPFEIMENIKSIALRADKGLLYIGSGVGSTSVIHQRSTNGAAIPLRKMKVNATIQWRSIELFNQSRVIVSAEFSWRTIEWIIYNNRAGPFVNRILELKKKNGYFIFPEYGDSRKWHWSQFDSTFDLHSLSLYDPDSQPPEHSSHECQELKCEHLCATEGGRARCRCRTDFVLMDDMVSCRPESVKHIRTISVAVLAFCLLWSVACVFYKYQGKLCPRRMKTSVRYPARKVSVSVVTHFV